LRPKSLFPIKVTLPTPPAPATKSTGGSFPSRTVPTMTSMARARAKLCQNARTFAQRPRVAAALTTLTAS
jgi:hypothetical protein